MMSKKNRYPNPYNKTPRRPRQSLNSPSIYISLNVPTFIHIDPLATIPTPQIVQPRPFDLNQFLTSYYAAVLNESADPGKGLFQHQMDQHFHAQGLPKQFVPLPSKPLLDMVQTNFLSFQSPIIRAASNPSSPTRPSSPPPVIPVGSGPPAAAPQPAAAPSPSGAAAQIAETSGSSSSGSSSGSSSTTMDESSPDTSPNQPPPKGRASKTDEDGFTTPSSKKTAKPKATQAQHTPPVLRKKLDANSAQDVIRCIKQTYKYPISLQIVQNSRAHKVKESLSKYKNQFGLQ